MRSFVLLILVPAAAIRLRAVDNDSLQTKDQYRESLTAGHLVANTKLNAETCAAFSQKGQERTTAFLDAVSLINIVKVVVNRSTYFDALSKGSVAQEMESKELADAIWKNDAIISAHEHVTAMIRASGKQQPLHLPYQTWVDLAKIFAKLKLDAENFNRELGELEEKSKTLQLEIQSLFTSTHGTNFHCSESNQLLDGTFNTLNLEVTNTEASPGKPMEEAAASAASSLVHKAEEFQLSDEIELDNQLLEKLKSAKDNFSTAAQKILVTEFDKNLSAAIESASQHLDKIKDEQLKKALENAAQLLERLASASSSLGDVAASKEMSEDEIKEAAKSVIEMQLAGFAHDFRQVFGIKQAGATTGP